ncbi:UDP-N-acetylglucosamine--N-acetylmuramyl-(pentapeptide) pyrophosphoryl-undecaprenol N-acetylglucosamine transferase [Helicobacter ibis]|uniref:UDP-N-acetylglucosamine--N-acetylmuramyl-(pentapeptide) pyrophosphoryl-undecaprenol N-acetylglucosamine transferase n=1 Tax=Helicobacter ibis TaxID=2962633 RepID=A0ABT4VCX8_9HELI|nr:UDP-N-acetylglucosamine--N-acetylmuramyl-(pentapeptide) pyrophosphoryl-undecaprenol N-acetylglucosamine transferase [Helicobacter ibis]MDA3968559.1 UDP-N-acetylglucosamine--N-acetylmuramyl-(pentapeptide) pyrophosphoryl-undecaprenol N-acetylglucosamine transferase [Helicobacter ibis]
MRVVIAGGGTGGHLSVARSFLEELHKGGYECIFIGSCNGQDKMYFENDDRFFKKYFLETSGVVNKSGINKLKSIFMHLRALKESISVLKENKIDCVISVGGYSAAPASFGAIFLKIPLIIHEQNAKIGRLNRILKPYAKVFFSSYLDSSPYKYYPIGEAFFNTARIRREVKTLLFMGGSQGAKAINDFSLSVSSELKERKIRIFHQCGKNDFSRVFEEYKSMGFKVKSLDDDLNCEFDVCVFDFSKNMPNIYNLCDFAVCRAGASSLWELCANCLPALFIPYPHAASNHQYYNAKFIDDLNLGFLCEEKDLFCDVLWNVLNNLDNISSISNELQKLCRIDALREMIEIIKREVLKENY